MNRDELKERYPTFAHWVRVFFSEDWLSDYPNAVASVQHVLEYFAGDRRQWVDDVWRFRAAFRTPDEQLAAAQIIEPLCNPDPVDFSLALSLIEAKFLEEIETGIDHREILDDE